MFNLEKAIIPAPKKIKNSGGFTEIASFMGKMPQILFESENVVVEEAANLIMEKLSSMTSLISGEYSDFTITLIINPAEKKLSGKSSEAYFIDVKKKAVTICGAGVAGVYYGATTFCQMLYSEGDSVLLPMAQITDYPDFSCRGMFMECRYGSEFMSKEDWFNAIDYISQMKLNTLTIGVYGCWGVQYDNRDMQYLYVPIKKYPQLKTPKNIKYYSVAGNKWIHRDNLLPSMYEEDFLGELMKYGKSKNVTVKPLFNSLGHNTLIPRAIPETCAMGENGEPTGFGFCTNNEKTYEVMFSIYDEIIDRYLIPNDISDIEIGIDEVGKNYICHCDKCKDKEHSEHIIEYIIRLCKYLKSRGMKRIYIYHDMLFHIYDVLNEDLKERFIKEGIYDEVVFDWWSYEDPIHLFYGRAGDVHNLFHSVVKPITGYYNWSIPTENNENIRACTKLAKELGFEGVETYSSFEYSYDKNYLTLADVSWNADNVDNPEDFDIRYAMRYYPDNVTGATEAFRALSDIMKDDTRMTYKNRACFKFDYYSYSYKYASKDYPRNFPGEPFGIIKEDESNCISYFEFLKQKSSVAIDFFENNSQKSHVNNMWLLTARQYYALADEYLTIYSLWKSYNSGITSEFEFVSQLDRLITQRESLMLLAENTRIEATSYTYLRNMSTFRQYMIDLRDYIKKEISQSRKPEFDITDLRNITGKKLEFLQ